MDKKSTGHESQFVITTRLVRLEKADLTFAEKGILIYLSSLIDLPNNKPSQATIARITGANLKTVKMVLKSLKAKGYVKIHKEGRRNIYVPIISKLLKEVTRNQSENGSINQPENGSIKQPKFGPLIDIQNSIERYHSCKASQYASTQAAPTISSDTNLRAYPSVAKGAQREPEGSLADEPSALAPSATPIKPPKKMRDLGYTVTQIEVSNTYSCEDTDLYRRSFSETAGAEEAL